MEEEISNYSEELAEAYYASKKDEWDIYAIEETARKEGFKQGIMKGEKEGMKLARIFVARRMKLANAPIDKIILYTGLDESQIEELQ